MGDENLKISFFRFATILFLAAFIPISGYAGAKSGIEKYSIQEIRQQTPDRWQNTYEAYGRTISVDCPVDLPDVTSFPILKVQWGTKVFPSSFRDATVDQLLASYNNGFIHGSGFSLEKNGPHIYPKGFMPNFIWTPEPWDLSQAYAYNNPLTLGQAIDMTKSFIDEYANGFVEIALDNVYTARNMKFINRTGEFTDEMDRAMGYYMIDFFQTLHSIPVLSGTGIFHAKGVGFGTPSPYSFIVSENEYLMGVTYVEETSMDQQDVPLCDFNIVKQQFESLITSGNVRKVESVRLGYVLYLDRSASNIGVAVPSWVMRCEYYPTAKEERPSVANLDNLHFSTGYTQILVNAQTGKMLEINTKDNDAVYCPDIILWD